MVGGSGFFLVSLEKFVQMRRSCWLHYFAGCIICGLHYFAGCISCGLHYCRLLLAIAYGSAALTRGCRRDGVASLDKAVLLLYLHPTSTNIPPSCGLEQCPPAHLIAD